MTTAQPALTVSAQRGSALRLHGLSKTYRGTQALNEVSFTVAAGTIHALLGGNGSGKSTLVKILAGVVKADPGGSIEISQRTIDLHRWTPGEARAAGLRFVHQNPGLLPDMSVAENLAAGTGYARRRSGRIHWAAQHRRTREVLARFTIPVDTRARVDSLGPATQTMIAIARALQDRAGADDGILVLDEPTAALPRAEVELLLTALRGYAAAGQTIILVSHRLDEVLEVADDVTVLRDGHHVSTQPASGLTKRDLVQLIAGRDIEQSARPVVAAGAQLLTVSGLANGPLRSVDLSVHRGQILGIAGLLGSGRTTLLRTIFGASAPRAGSIQLDGRPAVFRSPRVAMANGLAYVPDDRAAAAAFLNLAVRTNVSIANLAKFWQGAYFNHAAEARESAAAIAKFNIKCGTDKDPLSTLSGGNQQKVILARWLRREPTLILLDEPTQGVDVGARADICDLIRAAVDQGASVIVTSSDFEELVELCDTIAVLAHGRIVETFHRPGLRVHDLTEAAYGGGGAHE